ncbi:HTH-type transcriptional repressor CarH [soil metagenome]
MDRSPEVPLLRIGQLASATGVEAATLRTWEGRYGVPVSARTGGGQRRYSAREVERVRAMRRLIQAGYGASEAARMVASTLAGSLATSLPEGRRDVASLLTEGDPQALRLLDRLAAALPVEEVITDVLSPVMREIGVRWARGDVSVAQEHAASALASSWVGTQGRSVPPSLRPGLVVTATPQGERHELGLTMFALFLRRQGLRVLHAGSDLPAISLAGMVATKRPTVVCLSVSTDLGRPGLEEAIHTLEDHPESTLAVGGGWAEHAVLAERTVRLPPDFSEAARVVVTIAGG